MDDPAASPHRSADGGGTRPEHASGEPAAAPAPRGTAGPPSVLAALEGVLGRPPKVLLRDAGSAHDPSPLLQPGPAAARRLPAGRGNYQLLGEIARGGMGAVLKGHDTDLGRDVALKVLLERHAGEPAIVQRFVEEAQIGGQLQHPGIVPVYELGLLDDQRPFFTMKLVKGRTLAALLADRRSASDERRRFLTIFEQVCQTLAYAHARRVVHRDLKPANVMVGAFGEVQVVDWGLAKVLPEGGVADERRARAEQQVSIISTVRSSGSSAGSSESLAGSVMGTPAYMSPEQAQGEVERLDERTDVFALGAMLCEILTGAPPYVGEHGDVLSEAARARQEGARARLAACGADAELVELALQCLAPSRQARPRNADAVAREVAAFMARRDERARAAELAAVEARATAKQARKARNLALALAATVLLAVAAGGWSYVREQQRLAEQSERAAELARRVAAMLQESQLLRGQGRHEDALAVARRAEAVVAAASDAGPELTGAVAEVLAQVETAVAARRSELERGRRAEALLAALEEVQFSSDAGSIARSAQSGRDAAFEAAFRAAGLDVLGGDEADVTARLLALDRTTALALALDEWGRVRALLEGAGCSAQVRLLGLANALDDDPLRREVRRALLHDDTDAIRRLATAPELETWPPATVLTFLLGARKLGSELDYATPLRRSLRHHPDHYLLNLSLGYVLAVVSSEGDEEAVQYLAVARAMRPGATVAARYAVDELVACGRVDDAIALYLDQLVYLDQQGDSSAWRGTTLTNRLGAFFRHGRHDEALELLERAHALHPDDRTVLNNLAWRLCIHPDADKRQPERAVELARRAVAQAPESAALRNTLAVALFRAGRWEESLPVLQESIELSGGEEPLDWAVLAMVEHHLGRAGEASAALQRARELTAASDVQGADDPRPFLAEAEALLAAGA